MSICVIFNPAARGDKARKLRQSLDKIGASAELKATRCAGDARRLAKIAVEEGFQTVVAAGGDGTLNEVLNGMAEVKGGFSNARLGVLPLGTINVFARELKIPTNLELAWEVILGGKEMTMDVGLAEYGSAKERRYFLQLAGAGWDARAVELTNWELKKRIGPGAYVVAGLQAMASAQPKIMVSNGQETASGEVVIIGNGKLYGGTFPLLHQASYDDGILDAVIFPQVNWQSLPKYAWQFLSGQMFKPGATVYLRGSQISLTCAERAAFQLEGELVGELPATLTVAPRALRVVVPQNYFTNRKKRASPEGSTTA